MVGYAQLSIVRGNVYWVFPAVASFFDKGAETWRYSADATLFRITCVFLAVASYAQVYIVEGIFTGFFPAVVCFFDKGGRYRRTSMQVAVFCEISNSKELQNNYRGFYSPCILFEKDLCSRRFCKSL